jgi:flavin-dependent dehydrogenase
MDAEGDAMRAFTIAGILPGILAGMLVAAPAAAQVERLPEQSRAERQVDDLNRAMVRQGMQTRQNQQTQFEINQLRGEIQRSQQFPRMTGPCVPGAVC